jgi:hypothetical protein
MTRVIRLIIPYLPGSVLLLPVAGSAPAVLILQPIHLLSKATHAPAFKVSLFSRSSDVSLLIQKLVNTNRKERAFAKALPKKKSKSARSGKPESREAKL